MALVLPMPPGSSGCVDVGYERPQERLLEGSHDAKRAIRELIPRVHGACFLADPVPQASVRRSGNLHFHRDRLGQEFIDGAAELGPSFSILRAHEYVVLVQEPFRKERAHAFGRDIRVDEIGLVEHHEDRSRGPSEIGRPFGRLELPKDSEARLDLATKLGQGVGDIDDEKDQVR
jgi:hypothetical protein